MPDAGSIGKMYRLEKWFEQPGQLLLLRLEIEQRSIPRKKKSAIQRQNFFRKARTPKSSEKLSDSIPP